MLLHFPENGGSETAISARESREWSRVVFPGCDRGMGKKWPAFSRYQNPESVWSYAPKEVSTRHHTDRHEETPQQTLKHDSTNKGKEKKEITER